MHTKHKFFKKTRTPAGFFPPQGSPAISLPLLSSADLCYCRICLSCTCWQKTMMMALWTLVLKKRVGSAHTASGYIFQKVHSWIWRPLPKWKTQPMWPWRWVMASLCANTSRLVLQRWLLSQKHVKETCKLKTCNKTCFLRHPKPWKYFARNKFCKFGES